MNPGPVHKVCPNCNIHIHVKRKSCECGYIFRKKCGRNTGATRNAGFTVSSRRPWTTSNFNVELDVQRGCPVSNVDIELNVPMGRPTSNATIELNVPIGRPVSDVNIELDVPTGRPFGTTRDSGFSVSAGRPISSVDTTESVDSKETKFNDSNSDMYGANVVLEYNPVLLAEYMKQYDLPSAWDTDKTNVSLSDNLLARAKRRIGQQVRFDAKALGIAMCYCCGSILWSRVDNSHTHLVKLDLDDKIIPAVAYQCAMAINGRGYLEYRHKSGKLYACSVCTTFKHPKEYGLTFHIGKTNKSSTLEWDMAYPSQVMCLKTEFEKCQVALCGIFSATVKDAKRHQWRHIQGEVNTLHKLDKHYYGMFGFLSMNEKISANLSNNFCTYECIRVALQWLKKNNHLYSQFLARFETMYRYLRPDIVNPELLHLNQDMILEYEAKGMAFPVDSTYFDKYSPLYGNLDIAGIQNPKPHIIDKVQDSIEWLRLCTSVQYGQEYLLEKAFPNLFPYGEGGWYYKCLLGLSQFTKIRLLDPRGYFAKDSNFPFFMFDYMTKIRLRAYNSEKVVASGKLEENLSAGKVTAADKPLSDPYASYGTEVPRVVPGSKQYWKSFGYDLVAMIEQLGIPDFFVTLSPNDNWPHIQSTIKKGWGASADPKEFEDLSCRPENEESVGFNPLESVLGAEKRFSAMIDIILDKKCGPLGTVIDYAVKKEYQKRGGLHWHILFWVEPGTTPDDVISAELPRSSDITNVQAQYARRMVQRYQVHCECYPERCFKGYAGKILTKCKYGFPFKVPQVTEELDEDGIRYLYTHRCKEDQLIVPYNLEILLFWGASMNIQHVARHGFEMYLAKYISKPESSFNVKLSENPSAPERYLRTRIIGACEAIDVQLGFHQYQLSRSTMFLPTELKPQQQFLKHRAQLATLPQDSEDVYVQSKYQVYLKRNSALHDLTYAMYFQWWRKANYSEQCKGEKAIEKGSTPLIGYKGTDEYQELKVSITNLNNKIQKLIDELKGKSYLCSALQSVVNNIFQNSNTLTVFKKVFNESLNGSDHEADEIDKNRISEANIVLQEIGLLDRCNRPKKLHWLHTKLLQTHNNDEILSSHLYTILEAYPPGSMLVDTDGAYWVRRATAAVTRHRFITVEDQEAYYEQKYLLTVPLTPIDDVIANPPLSWVKAAIQADLVDEHHDAKANLLDAVKRGFSLENIQSIVKLYVEHQFLDEDEADAFLTTLPTGTSRKEEVREVTDQLLDDQEGGCLLPPHHVPLEEYTNKFTPSQERAFNWLKGSIEDGGSQVLGAIVGAAGCGKSFIMGAMVEYLKQCNLVVTKLAPSGVAASLIKGTTIRNFFKMDINGKSSLENGTIDASVVRKTNVIIIDEFSMIDCTVFITIEQLCRTFSSKDGRHVPWGGRHVLLFGDPAQLPPVSNTDIFNTNIWLSGFSIVQLKEIVRAKDPALSSILLKIREGTIDNDVDSVLKSRLRPININSVDLSHTVIICSRRKEVDEINAECLKHIEGSTHEFVAVDTDTNGQPLREADRQRLSRTATRLPDVLMLKKAVELY